MTLPYDGTIPDNTDEFNNFVTSLGIDTSGGGGSYGHGTYNSASCGNTTWGYVYHLPPTWKTEPNRKFPVVYVPSLGGGTNENEWFRRSQVADPLADSPIYTSNQDGSPWFLNWGKNANCVVIVCNGGVDIPYPFDANPATDMNGVLMLETQTGEILDFIESPNHPVFGGRLIPQGKDDPNGGKYRGIMGHSGGTHHSAYHAAKHPERYSSVFLLAVSGGGEWDPNFTTPGFGPWQIHMCNSDQNFGTSIWAINRPDGALGATFNANYNNIKNSGIWWHVQVSTPEYINEIVSDAFWNNLNNNGFNVDAEVKIPFGWHTSWAYTGGGGPQPLPWHISKFKLSPTCNGPSGLTIPDNAQLVLSSSQVTANDTDPQNLPLTVTAVSNPTHGTVSVSGGRVTFTPAAGYVGPASFHYSVQNSDGWIAAGTANIAVTAGAAMTIYNLIETGTNGYHDALSSAFAVTNGVAVAVSMTLKSSNRQVSIQFRKSDGSGGLNAYFDLTNGQTFGTVQWGTVVGSISNVTMTAQSDAYVCNVTFTPNFTGQAQVDLGLSQNQLQNASYQGDGVSFVEVGAISIGGTASDLGTWTLNQTTRTVVNTGTAAVWRDGTGIPANSLGNNGDYYLNDTNGDVYARAGGAYAKVANIKGATGAAGTNGINGTNGAPGSVWREGSGAPANTLGVNGDFYLNGSSGDVYTRASGTYSIVANIKGLQGVPGANGTNGTNGVGVPAAGTSGQVLTKHSGADFDTVWATPVSGGGGTTPFGRNVLDFGADPTGVNDSVVAFENAMKSAGSAGYGLVKVPLGKYAFSRACNLDVVNSQYGVRFEGEAVSVQKFGNESSTILGPGGDYAFKSTDASNTAAGLQHVFEHLAIASNGGGIYMSDGGITVRDCLFFGGGTHIYLNSAWKAYIGQCQFIGVGRGNAGASTNFGVQVFGQECTLDTIDTYAFGNCAVVLQGESMEVRQMRCESSERALILGQDQNGNSSFLNNFRISVGEMESNSREIWIRNASRGYIECFPILGHEILDGDVRTQYAILVDNAIQVKLFGMAFGGNYSQAAIITNNISQCKMEMCQGRNSLSILDNANYPAGTTTIQFSRSVFDTSLPSWLVPGLNVSDIFNPSAIQPGTVIQSISQPNTVVLSKPTAGRLVGTNSPPVGDGSIQGDSLSFTDAQGNSVGFFDGPASSQWVLDLCDVGR